ncbi:MAG: YARHG domain-containing protein [Muribaculaceae bacterium]|nr:YARHG domain-containing protein [Muribaculaceae bacterium]
MKRTALSLFVLCIAVCVRAGISESGFWYDGSLCYTAKATQNGSVLMNAMAEGEELEFLLVPEVGSEETYKVTDGPHDCLNLFQNVSVVKHCQDSGWDVLCFYDAGNHLVCVMSKETQWDSQVLNVAKWKNQIMGVYCSAKDELPLRINWDNIVIDTDSTELVASYKVETFNGLVTRHITIAPIEGATNRLEGTWEIVPTLDGIVLRSVSFDGESGWWKHEGTDIAVSYANEESDRFAYTATTLLNDRQFRGMSLYALRIMRNSIYARHGYSFSSPDLQEYFAGKPWYKPAASNDEVHLSFIEKLNAELIAAEEANPDHFDFMPEE